MQLPNAIADHNFSNFKQQKCTNFEKRILDRSRRDNLRHKMFNQKCFRKQISSKATLDKELQDMQSLRKIHRVYPFYQQSKVQESLTEAVLDEGCLGQKNKAMISS